MNQIRPTQSRRLSHFVALPLNKHYAAVRALKYTWKKMLPDELIDLCNICEEKNNFE